MGLVGLDEQKSSTFVVSNHNPIAIQIIYWQSDVPGVSVEFVGTSHGNISAMNQQKVSEQTKNLSRTEVCTWSFNLPYIFLTKLFFCMIGHPATTQLFCGFSSSCCQILNGRLLFWSNYPNYTI